MPKRVGRPPTPPRHGERVPLHLRVTAETKVMLEAAATENGRSLSQEAEIRLQGSFDRDMVLRGLDRIQGLIESHLNVLDEVRDTRKPSPSDTDEHVASVLPGHADTKK